jgi:hypothetical protein
VTQDAPARGLARWIGALRRRLDPDGETMRTSVRWVAHKLPELFEKQQRQSADMRALQHELESQHRSMGALNRDVGWMRRATTRQRAITSELLQLAGLQERTAERDQYLRERMTRIVRSTLPIIVGPWTGEVGFELLYWIPFLQALREQYAIDPDRLIVVSRGGVSSWYAHVTRHYTEGFDTVTPDAFREATEAMKKQRNPRAFEKTLVRAAMRARGIRQAHILHPSMMYELLWAYWTYHTTVRHVESFTAFKRLVPAPPSLLPPGLPRDYVAARFYFSECFPDTPANRAFVQRVLASLAAHTHVVLLNTPFAVDDHRDVTGLHDTRVHSVAAHMEPSTNLGVQTAIIAGAKAFVGTYGGYAYLAPFCGVHSTAFYSRTTFKRHHLDLAHRVFERLGTARLCAIDVRAAGAVELAFGSAAVTGDSSEPVTGEDPGLRAAARS